MPTYEYTCGACGQDQDIVQSMTDPTLTVCPLCQAEELRKRFTNVGVVFKGSGFYRTDARSDAKKGTDATAADTKKSADTSSSSSTAPATGSSSSASSTTSSTAPSTTKSSTASTS